MSLVNYTDLQTEVAARMRRSDLLTYIPGFISLFEAKANRALRVRRMIARATASLTDEYSLTPTDLLGVRTFSITSSSPKRQLDYLTPDQMDAMVPLAESGTPRYYTVAGTEFRYYPAPTSALTAALTYWQAIPALSNSNPTNWLMTNHPDAYVTGALEQANLFMKQFAVAQGLADELASILADIQQADDETHGGTLTPLPSTALAGYI